MVLSAEMFLLLILVDIYMNPCWKVTFTTHWKFSVNE